MMDESVVRVTAINTQDGLIFCDGATVEGSRPRAGSSS
jgi:hypothetical protein